jgi:hypothetical protein
MNPSMLAVSVILLMTAVPQRQIQSAASIEGMVVRAGTNEPIQGATIELTGIAPRTVEGSSKVSAGEISVSVLETETDGRVLSFTTTTDSDGRFMLRNLPPASGYHLIAIRQPDYLPAQYGQRIPATPGLPIDVADGQQLRDVRIQMTPGGSISGRVVDAFGQGVARVGVELRRPWYLEGWRLIADWQETISRVRGVGKTNRAAFSQTNERGEFRFSGLAPAHYYVRTTSTNDDDAPRIHLHAGADIQDVRLSLPQLYPRHVRGRVVRSETVVDSATISLVRRGAIPLYQRAISGSALSRGGTFDLVVGEPGEYFLIVTDRGRQGVRLGRKVIRVGDLDVDAGPIELAPAFDIAGTVAIEDKTGTAAKTGLSVSLSLYSLVPGIPTIRPVPLTVPEGRFTVRGVTTGHFRIEISPISTVPPTVLLPAILENAYVKSVRLGRTDVLNSGLHLESSVDAPMEVVISMHGAAVRGRVIDESRKPAVNAMVVLVPDNERRSRGDLYKSVSSDDSGAFQIRGIPPGEYKIFAWERVEHGAWQDPEFMKIYEDRGSRVRVAEDGQYTVDATRIPAWN